ncbi:hypothetical protein [Streptomyces sp. NPDC052721]|uniref:hypothetical protein n=1 Tax=Streptomyces sp. NPDC052721 TaxID=3154955 RepID=UPI003437F24D
MAWSSLARVPGRTAAAFRRPRSGLFLHPDRIAQILEGLAPVVPVRLQQGGGDRVELALDRVLGARLGTTGRTAVSW